MGISSDGDPRLLMSMKTKMDFLLDDLTDSKLVECWKKTENSSIFVQDTVHIGTKMRNRLLNQSTLLALGNRIISISHIQTLLKSVSKEVHGLVKSDILPQDRQNFSSLDKLMNDRVLDALEKNTIGTEGTHMYLVLCKQITSSFLDSSLSPIERIYRIWNALFFMRAWKKWIEKQKNYSLKNFVSSNVMACIEINAHALIYAILKLKKNPEWFHPILFSSQPCESMFRHMRSMATANFTKINFTLYELLHMVARVELMNNIAFEKFANKEIIFPRLSTYTKCQTQFELPTMEGILETIKHSLADALRNATRFKLNPIVSEVSHCSIQFPVANLNLDTNEFNYIDSEDDELEYMNESQEFSSFQIDEGCKRIEIVDSDGTMRTIRKSTLVWMLTESSSKLSNDRLRRVQNSDDPPKAKRQRRQPQIPVNGPLTKLNEIEIGQWCFFNVCASSEIIDEQSLEENILGQNILGEVVAFRYANGRNEKERKYNLDFVPIPDENDSPREIEVLASWYICNQIGLLEPVKPANHVFINLKNYKGTTTNVPIYKQENDSEEKKIMINSNISVLKQLLNV